MNIKKFDELILEAVRKLFLKIKEETDNSLAYMLDEGYQVLCKDDLRWITVNVNLLVPDATPFVNLKWFDIKNDIMPYFNGVEKKKTKELMTFWLRNLSPKIFLRINISNRIAF